MLHNHNHTKNNVNFWGRLKSPAAETEYFQYERNATVRFISNSIFAFGVIFFLISIYDYVYNDQPGDFFRSLIIRTIVLILSAICSALLKTVNKPRPYYLILSLFPMIIFFSYICLLAMQKAQGLAYQGMAIMVILFASTMLPIPWVNLALINTLTSVFFITFSQTYITDQIALNYIEVFIYLFITILVTSVIQKKNNANRRERYVWEKELEIQSTIDKLTGCYNRLWFDNKLAEFSSFKGNDANSRFSLIMFDIDDFKMVNDRYGHLAGDQALTECAGLVKDSIRPGDFFARWGGEEFVILLPLSSLEESCEVAERIRERIAGHTFKNVLHFTCSFGLAENRPGERAESLIQRADNMLYRAKKNGKNQVVKDG